MEKTDLRAAYLADIGRAFRNYKTLAERAIAQVADDDLHTLVDPDANSLAIVVKHLAGNLRSRFTDFLTTDGEKPDRNRDDEFEMPGRPARAELLQRWEAAWTTTLATLGALAPDDLDRTIHIRGEAFLVLEALDRSITHTAYHVGQIVFLAKHFAGARWTSLSIPKGRSAEFVAGSYKKGIVPKAATNGVKG